MTLSDLIKESVRRVSLMSPEEKAAMLEKQRRSWVVGELMLEYPELTKEEANARYDRIIK